MYTRSYYDTQDNISLPENYVGTAFREAEEALADSTESVSEAAPSEDSVPSSALPLNKPTPFLGGILGSLKLPFADKLRLPEIGSEEILIIATAMFLLFSKNGDLECAIMLLLLLLIN